jgi:hypothetical protein
MVASRSMATITMLPRAQVSISAVGEMSLPNIPSGPDSHRKTESSHH